LLACTAASRAERWPFARSFGDSAHLLQDTRRSCVALYFCGHYCNVAYIRHALSSRTTEEAEIPANSRQLRLWRGKLGNISTSESCFRVSFYRRDVKTELSIVVSLLGVVGSKVNYVGVVHTSTSRTDARKCLVA